jgi:hypothetical protein
MGLRLLSAHLDIRRFGSFSCFFYKLPDHASDWNTIWEIFIHAEISSLLSRLADQFMIQDLRSERGLMPIHDTELHAEKTSVCGPYFPLCSSGPFFFLGWFSLYYDTLDAGLVI